MTKKTYTFFALAAMALLVVGTASAEDGGFFAYEQETTSTIELPRKLKDIEEGIDDLEKGIKETRAILKEMYPKMPGSPEVSDLPQKRSLRSPVPPPEPKPPTPAPIQVPKVKTPRRSPSAPKTRRTENHHGVCRRHGSGHLAGRLLRDHQ